MFANVLGHLDPKTGVNEGISAEDARIRTAWPELDKDGNIWFTAELEGSRQARSEDRRGHRIQAAGRRARSAHSAVCARTACSSSRRRTPTTSAG